MNYARRFATWPNWSARTEYGPIRSAVQRPPLLQTAERRNAGTLRCTGFHAAVMRPDALPWRSRAYPRSYLESEPGNGGRPVIGRPLPGPDARTADLLALLLARRAKAVLSAQQGSQRADDATFGLSRHLAQFVVLGSYLVILGDFGAH